MGKLSPNKSSRDSSDLIAFLACLVTGVLLLVIGHLTVGSLTVACTALGGVYGAWRRHR